MNQHHCPVCENAQLRPFLRRFQVPVHQNLVVNSQEAARTVTRGELDLVICDACGFVFNQAFDLSRLSYGEDYDNTQSCSAYFDAYLDGLVRDMVECQGVRNCTIVEIGCGKGHFLKKLVNYPGANNTGFGFDPSYVGPLTDLGGQLQFRPCYYDQSCTDIAADVVVCRHVIEHVPEPLEILHSVRTALESSLKARVFFETPCVEWILRHRVIWDFFYEHCSLFTAESLGLAFRRAGFAVKQVEHIFGGQYLWLEACVADVDEASLPMAGETVRLVTAYATDEQKLRDDWLARLRDLGKNGKVALWGAGAKGATFANLVDPQCALIDCVVDLNPNKQGRFIPGTGHPIVSPADLPGRGVCTAILMNPNYRQENLQLLAEAGIELNLIDWSE
ncbi:MAG: class I SAM-dependent methyltransferase [Desulfobulbaceae bacterium]|nr:class I SAM-dependent methyltransferase [Desulfobulbaceae bacterium]HIJ89303.1 methyltransferase domain-containing protein [Deltaproteobacteria bacterium]